MISRDTRSPLPTASGFLPRVLSIIPFCELHNGFRGSTKACIIGKEMCTDRFPPPQGSDHANLLESLPSNEILGQTLADPSSTMASLIRKYLERHTIRIWPIAQPRSATADLGVQVYSLFAIPTSPEPGRFLPRYESCSTRKRLSSPRSSFSFASTGPTKYLSPRPPRLKETRKAMLSIPHRNPPIPSMTTDTQSTTIPGRAPNPLPFL